MGERAKFIVAGGVHPKFPEYGRKMLAEIANRPQLSFLGYLDAPSEFYQQVDLVIFPTSYVSEAVPGVVLEALSSGCGVVLRRTNSLPAVFAGAPVHWFDTQPELLDLVTGLVAGGREAVQAGAEQAPHWVQDAFPTQADWLARLERHLLDEGDAS